MPYPQHEIRRVVDLIAEHGTYRAAAAASGLSFGHVQRRYAQRDTLSVTPEPKTKKSRPVTTAPAGSNEALAAAIAALAEAQIRQSAIQSEILKRLTAQEKKKPTTAKQPDAKAKAEKPEKPIAGGEVQSPEVYEQRATGKRFMLSVAQNNTFGLEPLFRSMENFMRHRGATLHIARCSYNKKAWAGNQSRITKEDEGLWYDPEVAPYVQNAPLRLADDLIFLADSDISPSAVNPLSGYQSYSKQSSGIFPHPKIAMESQPVLKGENTRFLYTTGAVTQRNYIKRKAGQKAAFHHSFGFLYVEVDDDGAWFARQVIADEDGTFYDLDEKFTPQGVERVAAEGMVWGDLHDFHMQPVVREACWGRGGIIDFFNPRVQAVHDAHHQHARTHHPKTPFERAQIFFSGKDRVEDEVDGTARTLSYIQRPRCLTVVPDANHHDHLEKWLSLGSKEIDGDPLNGRYFHFLKWKALEAAEFANDNFDVFRFALEHSASKQGISLGNIRFLKTDESFSIAGIELGVHGHLGPNGSRGSPRAYTRLGRKAVTGHTHTAGIIEGVYTVGVTASLDQGYNKGPSSWSHTHCVIYANGKRALITMRGGRWRGGMQPAAQELAIAA